MYMSRLYFIVMIVSLISCQSHELAFYENDGTFISDHSEWSELLAKHVNKNGNVDYEGFKGDHLKLEQYINSLVSSPPTLTSEKNQKLAYWINLYNALTVQLITENYPIKSIQDLHPHPYIPLFNSVWKKPLVKINGNYITLHMIEHDILREEFEEPGIHFAINCASKSCPKLRNEAYVAERIDEQLSDQLRSFLISKNDIQPSSLKLSKLFQWYQDDFTVNRTIRAYISSGSEVVVDSKAKITYIPYDWSLNTK